MSKSTYLLRPPTSVKTAAARLAKAEGVSLNQFIASAVAEKVGVIETARQFLEQRAGDAKPKDLLKYLRKAGPERPVESERRYSWMKFTSPMATYSADTASPPPPSRIPAGPRASSRH